MDKFTFGITMLLVGMGGTILTLALISVLITLLKKIFPLKNEETKD
ncbi:MAG: OadG family protein [Deltaproteobacteria bacterium]|nr:OadG family protein [Deltaproteobacteria bacterium]